MDKIENQDDAVLLAHALAYHLQKQGNRLAADIIRAAIPAIPGLTAEAMEARMEAAPQPPAEAQAQGGGEPMTGDLLPCPFCGKSNQDRWPCEWLDGTGANVIRCAWCHGAAPASTWNRRTAPPSAPVGVEAIVDAIISDPANATDTDTLRRCVASALAQQPAAPSAPVGVEDRETAEYDQFAAIVNALHGSGESMERAVVLARSVAAALAAKPAACDMSELCIGCEPRNADGTCPDQQPAAVDGAAREYLAARDAYDAATRPPNSHAQAPRLKHGDPIVLRLRAARVALDAALAAQPGGSDQPQGGA